MYTLSICVRKPSKTNDVILPHGENAADSSPDEGCLAPNFSSTQLLHVGKVAVSSHGFIASFHQRHIHVPAEAPSCDAVSRFLSGNEPELCHTVLADC